MQPALGPNRAWIVDHGPVRLHRDEPEDIIPQPLPRSRVRRKVDAFKTMASRAATRIGDLRTRIGHDIKTRANRRQDKPPPRSNKRMFTAYDDDDNIFINPFGATVSPDNNFRATKNVGNGYGGGGGGYGGGGGGYGGGHGGGGGGGSKERNQLAIARLFGGTNTSGGGGGSRDDTYERIHDHRASLSDAYHPDDDVSGVRRLSIDEDLFSGDGDDDYRKHAYEEPEEEYEPEPEVDFQASEVTTNYGALNYLACTGRKQMLTTMWRFYRDRRGQGDILHEACRRGHTELLRELLEQNVDVNLLDRELSTALYQAVVSEHSDCAQLLIDKGAVSEINEKVEPGKSVLHTAARLGNLRVARHLVAVDRWVNVNAVGEYDYTPLHVAADSGHADVITFLLDSGASIDALTKSDRTAFEIAMHNSKLDIATLLLDRGASIERFDDYGRSILHWAAGSASPDIVRFLLDHSASPRLANKEGIMPHHVAARHGRPTNLHVLLTRGAPLNAPRTIGTNSAGQTALVDALEAKKYSCVSILVIHGAGISVTSAGKEDSLALLLRLANTFAHEPKHFGGQLIESFLYSGHVPSISRAIREVTRKMNLYADLEAWYRLLLPRPPSLRNLCRAYVRKSLIERSYGVSIYGDVLKLDLPSSLHDFLLMKECDTNGVLAEIEPKSSIQ